MPRTARWHGAWRTPSPGCDAQVLRPPEPRPTAVSEAGLLCQRGEARAPQGTGAVDCWRRAKIRDVEGARVQMNHNPLGPILDDTTRAIIEQLQEDGRRPYTAIGQAVGLSEAATRQRVRNLVDSGVVQIVGITDPTQVGFGRQAMIGITATGDLDLLASELCKIPEAEYIAITAGSYDLIVEVVARDDRHLMSILNKQIRQLSGVIRTESLLYLKLVKQNYNWTSTQPPGDEGA